MLKLTVVNNGKRTRHRLGVGFKPKEKTEIEVTAKEYITIKAVKDFEIVEKVDTREKQGENNDSNIDDDSNQEGEGESSDFDFESLNIDEIVSIVEDGQITPEKAIAYELKGKNRSTLIAKLEDMKEGE